MEKKSVSPIKLLLMSSAGMFLDGYQLTVVALAILIMKPDLGLSDFGASLMIDSLILGTIIGAVSVGYLADRFGRRRIYMYNLLFFLIFGIASVATFNFILIVVFRVMMGIAVGADYPVSNSYIAEMAPEKLRGKFLSFSSVAFVIGALSSSLVAALFFYLNFPDSSWRYMIGIGLIPAAVVLVLRLSMPESEKWEKVRRVRKKGTVRAMFRGKSAKFTILTSVIWFIYDMGAFGIGLLVPSLLQSSNLIGNYYENAIVTSAFLVIGLISGVIVIMLVERIGRKSIQMLGFLGMGISLILIPYTFFTFLIVILAFAEFSNGWPSATVGIFPAELASTEFRSSAYGLAATIGKLGAVAGVLIIGNSINPSSFYIFTIFGLVMFSAIIMTLFLRETGKLKLDEMFLPEV